MRADPGREHTIPLLERLLPKRHDRERTALAVFVAAPHIVDQDVEPSLILPNAVEQRFDLCVDRVVATNGDAAAAAAGDLLGSLVNRARHVVGGRPAADASARHISGSAGGAKLQGNTAARTAACASYQSDDVVEPCHVLGADARSKIIVCSLRPDLVAKRHHAALVCLHLYEMQRDVLVKPVEERDSISNEYGHDRIANFVGQSEAKALTGDISTSSEPDAAEVRLQSLVHQGRKLTRVKLNG